jgi:hypothetical protein
MKNLRRKSFGQRQTKSSAELLTNDSALRRMLEDILGRSHL